MTCLVRRSRGVVVVSSMFVLALGFAPEASAAGPRGIFAQRRGYRMPARPTIIDSSPTIEMLNKALKALGATDRDYDGHREKAIVHIGLAIRHLENPLARGGSNAGAAVAKAAAGPKAKTSKVSQAASDENLRKAKTLLFSAHHKLADHTATKGQLRADVEVRVAIGELVAALNPPPASKTASKASSASQPASARTR